MPPSIETDPTPGTETATTGEAVELATVPLAQTERPVDIMKVGGKILAYERFTNGEPDGMVWNDRTFERVGDEIIRDSGDIALVTSAGIIAGMQATGATKRPDPDTKMPELQRLSSVGRRYIENKWAEFLPGREIGGLSLTSRELDDVVPREETLRTIERHFAYGDVPVINENDAITHAEISFGSNDILAAKLAARMQDSDLFGTVRLFLLTDVNGVYGHVDDDPFSPNYGRRHRIPVIGNTSAYRDVAGEAGASFSIGGVASKFDAADIAKEAGVDMWIYNPSYGHRERAVEGKIGTYFPATV